MPQDKDHSRFNANDFERYYSGKMSPKEMYALEKAAQEDPFLGDAFEGYKNTSTPSRDMAELHARLNKKKERNTIWYNRKGPSQLLKIAAILVLFAGVWWMSSKENTDQAANETILASRKSPVPATAPAETVISDSAPVTTKDVATSATDTKTAKPDIKETMADMKMRSNSAFNVDPDTIRAGKEIYAMEAAPTAANSSAKNEVVTSNTENKFAGKELPGKVPGMVITDQNNIQGRILDVSGKPVTFATVMEKGNNSGMVVDNSGVFNYMVKDSNSPLVINAEGYQSRTVRVVPGKMQDLILKSQTLSLSEKDVAAKTSGAKRKALPTAIIPSEPLPRVVLKNASPAAGWDELSKYVKDSTMNVQANANQIRGEVVVRFEVNSRNEPTGIKIKKHLCNACDAEAIRIIKSQSWQLTGPGKKAEATVRF